MVNSSNIYLNTGSTVYNENKKDRL